MAPAAAQAEALAVPPPPPSRPQQLVVLLAEPLRPSRLAVHVRGPPGSVLLSQVGQERPCAPLQRLPASQ